MITKIEKHKSSSFVHRKKLAKNSQVDEYPNKRYTYMVRGEKICDYYI